MHDVIGGGIDGSTSWGRAVPQPPEPQRLLPEGERRWSPAGMTWIAAAFAMGIALGWHWFDGPVWMWGGGAFLLCAAAWWAASRWRRAAAVIALAAVACVGSGWMTARLMHAPADELSRLTGSAQVLLQARGRVVTTPEYVDRAWGPLALFDLRGPVTQFELQVMSVVGRDGVGHKASGLLRVRHSGLPTGLEIGDTVRVFGLLTPPRPPTNPGELDREVLARCEGRNGLLSASGEAAVHVVRKGWVTPGVALAEWRNDLRRSALSLTRPPAWLGASPEREALIRAMLIGEPSAELDELNATFRTTGLAHLVAISGFNLAVLAAGAAFLLRLGGPPRRWHGWLIIAVVGAYLMAVRPETPVLRAGIMAICASLGMAAGRRWSAEGLVSLSAVVLLWYRPQDLMQAGFQLSFGVVLGLLWLQPVIRRRLFRETPETWTVAWVLRRMVQAGVAAALASWIVAAPITAHHFAMVSPWGLAGTLVATPLASLVLAIGYLRLAVQAALPGAEGWLDVPLALAAEGFIALVELIGAIPGTQIRLPSPGPTWTLIALLAGVVIVRVRGRWRWKAIVTAALIGWLVIPAGEHDAPAGGWRVDMVAVGDGSCYVVRSEGSAVVFDAGSVSNPSAAWTTIAPAMRALGVTTIDAMVLSHANLDHYSGMLELARTYRPPRLLVTARTVEAARSDPEGAIGVALRVMEKSGARIEVVARGHREEFGATRWRWIHPEEAAEYASLNDHSQAIHIEGAGRSLLLLGDGQPEAIAAVLAAEPDLRATLMELPHHGSWNEVAAELVETVDPEVVLQSTGPERLLRDRWADLMSARVRLVTCVDGWSWVSVDASGHVRRGAWRSDVR